jgi:hypothetical protein
VEFWTDALFLSAEQAPCELPEGHRLRKFRWPGQQRVLFLWLISVQALFQPGCGDGGGDDGFLGGHGSYLAVGRIGVIWGIRSAGQEIRFGVDVRA